MEKVLYLAAECGDGSTALSRSKQMRSITASGSVARMVSPNVPSASAVSPIDMNGFDGVPGGTVLIRVALTAADGDDVMAGPDQPRDEIGADVASGADDSDSHTSRSYNGHLESMELAIAGSVALPAVPEQAEYLPVLDYE